jgi:hypothetical protein
MSGPIVPTKLAIDEKNEVAHNEDAEKSDFNDSIDPIEEKKLLLKVDMHVVPPLLILFLLAFLDRVNIGNAKIQGMTKELHMVGQDYSIALFIFFIPYVYSFNSSKDSTNIGTVTSSSKSPQIS